MDQPERDPPPWEALITEHIRRDAGFFYRLAQRIAGRSAAEDACQQAFLNVWQQRHICASLSGFGRTWRRWWSGRACRSFGGANADSRPSRTTPANYPHQLSGNMLTR